MAYGVGQQSGMMRPVLKDPSGLELLGQAGYGNSDNPGIIAGSLATVGAGTLLNNLVDGQFIYRTGPTAGFTDTFDTAVNLDAGVGNGMNPGDAMVIWYSNQVAFAATIAGAAGVTLASAKSSIAASALGMLVLYKLKNAVPNTPLAYNSQGQLVLTYASAGVYSLYVM